MEKQGSHCVRPGGQNGLVRQTLGSSDQRQNQTIYSDSELQPGQPQLHLEKQELLH